MKKIFLIFVISMFICLNAEAKNNINNIIKASGISNNSISISVKNQENGKTLYASNDKILMHPASVQKALTIVPIADALGENYELSTELYKHGTNSYLLKLGADPYLTTSDLKTLINKIDISKINKMYLDDSIIENKDWGEGWQWDDDLNPSMPRFNAYNLDGNVIKLTIMPTENGKQTQIINQNKYPLILFNNVLTGNSNKISVIRDNVTSSNTLKLDGTVNSPYVLTIPNNNLKRYFYIKLTGALEDNKIYLKEAYAFTKKNSNDVRILSIKHNLTDAIDDILLNSNNMAIETLSKIASGKMYNKQGTDEDGIRLFKDYCEKQGIDTSGIRIVDASGVSKNNLSNADFISEFLIKNKKSSVLQRLAVPGQGTLSNRMIPLKDNLKAKTGTLSDISSIAGYLTTKKGKKCAFCIIINDPSSSSSAKKNLEDYLIRDFYLNL